MNKYLMCLAEGVVCMVVLAADESKIEAMRSGAIVREVLRVVDEQDAPVPDAKVWGGLSMGGGLSAYTTIDGKTDSNGVFVVEGICRYGLRCEVSHVGFYTSELKINYASSKAIPSVVDGKWQPYGKTRKITLKQIKSQGDLVIYDPQYIETKIPALDKWLALDLEKFDWIEPIGRGKHKDVLVKFSHRKGGIRDQSNIMELSFTNNPYAGAYVRANDDWSELKSDKRAMTNENFASKFVFGEKINPNGKDDVHWLDENSYLVYRTRTKVDEKGRLVSAHYGKVYGLWRSNQEFMRMALGCFNPRENDPDIEDDRMVRAVLKRPFLRE